MLNSAAMMVDARRNQGKEWVLEGLFGMLQNFFWAYKKREFEILSEFFYIVIPFLKNVQKIRAR